MVTRLGGAYGGGVRLREAGSWVAIVYVHPRCCQGGCACSLNKVKYGVSQDVHWPKVDDFVDIVKWWYTHIHV